MSTTRTAVAPKHKVVSQQEWVAARKELLKAEKEFAGKNVVLVVTGANIAPDILRRAVASNL